MADRDIEQAADLLPGPVTVREGETPDLPDLPPGFRWELKVTADAEVIGPDGKVKS